MPEKKLEQRLRDEIRRRAYARSTEDAYVYWYKQYVLFHSRQHPATLGAKDIETFLTHLAVDRELSAASQNQAFNALLFLYRDILNIELAGLNVVRAKRTHYIQPYLSHAECLSVIHHLTGVHRLVLSLIYGGGLRLNECLRLRLKDVDLDNKVLYVHETKSDKSRATFLPDWTDDFTRQLQTHIAHVEKLHAQHPSIPASLPLGLDRKYRSASTSLAWQYLFPARDIAYDKRTGAVRRHHLNESGFQRALQQAVQAAQIHKHVTAHTFRAAFAHRLKESGYSLDDIQKLMGHADPRTTQHYLDGAPPPHTRLRGPLSKPAG